MTSSSTAPPTSRRRRIATMAVIAIGAALALAFLLWVAWSFATRTTGRVVSYKVTSDHSVRITVQVMRQPDTEARCIVRARNRAGAEVGRAAVEVPAGPERSVVFTHTLATRDVPISGELYDCRDVE